MGATNRPIVDVARYVRAMSSRGHGADDLARRCGIGLEEVGRILAARSIKGILAGKIRNRAAAGWTAAAIAEGLRIDADAVRAFLSPPLPPSPPPPKFTLAERLARRQPHRRGRDADTLNRPRSLREMEALSEWSRFLRDDPDPPPAPPPLPLPPADVAELPGAEPCGTCNTSPAPAVPAMLEEWGAIRASQASAGEGGSNGNAALTDADAVRIRERRAAGVPRADLAREYGVSVATVTRITRGETYRTAAAVEGDGPVAVELPATSPVEGPRFERWEEPGDRRRRG